MTSVKQDIGRLTARHNFLVQADGVFTESNNHGISHGITELFNAVRDVATNPESDIQRTVLLAKANSLTDEISRAAQSLDQIRRDADGEIGQHITTVNSLASQIASLNDQNFPCRGEWVSPHMIFGTDVRPSLNELAELVEVRGYRTDRWIVH